MINANELRVGNTIVLNGSTTTLTLNDFYWEIETARMFEDAHPIPLNREWLLKMEFNASQREWFEIRTNFGAICISLEYKKVVILDHSDSEICVMDYIPMVHELQNLYFALTKKELNVTF